MHKRRLALTVQMVLAMLLSGCSLLSSNLSSKLSSKLLAPELLSPASFGQNLQASQQLEVMIGEDQRQLLIAFAVDDQQLRVTGLTANGQRLLSISYDGHQTHSQYDQLLPEVLDPDVVLAQLQQAYWPLAALQANYAEPWRIVETGQQRQLWYEQTPVLRVDYLNHMASEALVEGHRISLYDHRFDITLYIRTLTVHSE